MESTIVLNLNFLSYYRQKLMVFKEKNSKSNCYSKAISYNNIIFNVHLRGNGE